MLSTANGFDREDFDAQVVVFQTGDSGDAAYVIETGRVEVLVGPPDAQRQVAVLAEGAMFGEVALLDRQPRTATVRTLVPTRLLRIDRAHVQGLLERADPVIQYLLRILLQRFRTTSANAAPTNADHPPAGDAAAPAAERDVHSAAVRTLMLAHDLANAIDAEQLTLYYQPIVTLPGRALAGFEALVRWRHPTIGMVSPDEFIPVAEKTGVIHRIGQWVLERAMRDWPALRALCSTMPTTPFVSVNLSAAELCNPGTLEFISERLQAHGMAPQDLHIELTETAVIGNIAAVSHNLQTLRGMQVGVALDDFGTGYAGLGYLQTLPFSSIKVDKSFVQQMHESGRSFQIIKSALELSRKLDLDTVAEGIEDLHTANVLQDMGCAYAQGYYFARPMPLESLSTWATSYVPTT
jgi:EAL domain-containing protein (putative c-di-GMP-specific phosphodiesterase class I)